MRGWFRGLRWKRRPAVQITQLNRDDIADIPYAFAWNLTITQWRELDERDRADKRLNVCHAPNFAGAGK
ncbi:hypothetical protein [Pseudarthrobacter sp. LT1]|uniref:hypothetical protein n=1 Tax=Pseudarthrobacter sp. LT1 TaxID=3111450 RepID=UPI002D79A89C|nr:hypothetical protein [Pseudarthrobacter sp. LT1]WRT14693.1 hypothetical protein VIK36_04140 [Pseudarthrobacter sp. LT1]